MTHNGAEVKTRGFGGVTAKDDPKCRVLSLKITLAEGKNVIEIVATDGKAQASKVLTVTFTRGQKALYGNSWAVVIGINRERNLLANAIVCVIVHALGSVCEAIDYVNDNVNEYRLRCSFTTTFAELVSQEWRRPGGPGLFPDRAVAQLPLDLLDLRLRQARAGRYVKPDQMGQVP